MMNPNSHRKNFPAREQAGRGANKDTGQRLHFQRNFRKAQILFMADYPAGNFMLRLVLLVAVIFLLCAPPAARGAGFALVNQGTAAMAQGNAFVAEADDPSAIYYNPAGLNQIQRPVFYTSGFLYYPDREFHGSGLSAGTEHQLSQTMSAYFVFPVIPRLSVGISYFSPFGLGSKWPSTWPGRYLSTYSSLKTYTFNPVASVKLLDNLSLAAGFDVMWSSVEINRNTPNVVRGHQFPDGEASLCGNGHGWGYNLGVLYEPVAGVKLGASYRSEITVKYFGTLELSEPPPFSGLVPAHIGGSAPLTFPPSVTWGIAYGCLKPFTFEFDTTWTGWSTYDQLRVKLDTPIPVNGVPSSVITTPKNWHDAWAFRFGVNYEIKEGLKLRAGYIYDLTPVPDDTFDPQVPDANRHIFTLGGDLTYKSFTLGIAYNYILQESRNKSSAILFNGVPATLQANGRYNTNIQALAMSLAYHF
jgi:long-chain fatty acid transport protein